MGSGNEGHLQQKAVSYDKIEGVSKGQMVKVQEWARTGKIWTELSEKMEKATVKERVGQEVWC